MFCVICDVFDEFVSDRGYCLDCEDLYQRNRRDHPAPEGLCKYGPCTNAVISPKGKVGRPKLYCSDKCSASAKKARDAARKRRLTLGSALHSIYGSDRPGVREQFNPYSHLTPENGFHIAGLGDDTEDFIPEDEPSDWDEWLTERMDYETPLNKRTGKRKALDYTTPGLKVIGSDKPWNEV